jgi:dTDP-4-dehydrorhamnose 3,5-epimerase
MIVEETILNGVFILNNFCSTDRRGVFVKTFNNKNFREANIDFEIREAYYSVSHKDVVRGMHFQLPPNDHEKLVYVPKGAVIDVVLDLRKNSKTFQKFIAVELSQENRKSIFIPKGLAHGFKSLEDNTITVYNVSTEYYPDSDTGIHFESFGFNWVTNQSLVSKRDNSLIGLEEFISNNPF